MRPAGRGFGILAQGAFLATHASSDSSSPTKRGLFRSTACSASHAHAAAQRPADRPADARVMTRASVTRLPRARRHQLRRMPQPVGSIGFGFEHYDEGGRFRDTEAGLPINSAASVPDRPTRASRCSPSPARKT